MSMLVSVMRAGSLRGCVTSMTSQVKRPQVLLSRCVASVMSTPRRLALATAALVLVLACSAQARIVPISEYKLSDSRLNTLRDRWVDQLMAHHSIGTWAPMKFNLTNADLKLMGLPPKRVLLAHHYRRPTVVRPDGRMWTLGAKRKSNGKGGHGGSNSTTASGGTISYAGAGFL